MKPVVSHPIRRAINTQLGRTLRRAIRRTRDRVGTRGAERVLVNQFVSQAQREMKRIVRTALKYAA